MSNVLLDLVWGAKPFGNARTGPSMRLVLASLADQVNEKQHGNWCFPRLQEIQDRTEMGRRTVLRALAALRKDNWLRIENRPGFGSAYFFDIERLKAAQRPKRERCLVGTHAFKAPVPSGADTGALNDVEGCLERLPNKEEPEVNQKEPVFTLRVVDVAPSSKDPKPPKAAKQHSPQYTIQCAIIAAVEGLGKKLPKWGPDAAGRLSKLLKSVEEPSGFFLSCIAHWRDSDPRHHAIGSYMALISRLVEFQDGPKDSFGNVLQRERPRGASSQPSAAELVEERMNREREVLKQQRQQPGGKRHASAA